MPLAKIVYASTWMAIYVGIPFWFIFAPTFSDKIKWIRSRSIEKGMLISTLIMWPLMIMHRTEIEVPYILSKTHDPLYDGVGGNVGIMMFGWFAAIVFQLPHILMRRISERISHAKNKGEQVVDGKPHQAPQQPR